MLTNFSSALRNFWIYRHLIWQMSKREVAGRYRGSFMGVLWSFINPLLLLMVYTFVFSIVFHARFGSDNVLHQNRWGYALILFSGITLFGLLSECLTRAPSLINTHANFVKKVIFPLEILPCITLCSAFFHLLIGLFILLVFNGLLNHSFPSTVIFLPLILLPFLIFTLSCILFISATGVFLRDLGQAMGLVTTVLLFLSPVFYSRSNLPTFIQSWLLLNPMTFIVEQFQRILFLERMPDMIGLGLYSMISLLLLTLSLVWFQKTRKAFADVI